MNTTNIPLKKNKRNIKCIFTRLKLFAPRPRFKHIINRSFKPHPKMLIDLQNRVLHTALRITLKI